MLSGTSAPLWCLPPPEAAPPLSCYCCRCCGFPSPPQLSSPGEGSFLQTYPVFISPTLYAAYKVAFMLCSILKWSVHQAKTRSRCGRHWQRLFWTMRQPEVNNDGESLNISRSVWWTAVKWLSKLCLCHVALFPLSISVLNELLNSNFYMLICDLTHWGINITFSWCRTKKNWEPRSVQKLLS